MTDLTQNKPAQRFRGIGLRQIRLACGLVLFSYLVSHFLNHALGNISVDAMTAGVFYHSLFWQFLPVAIVLYTAAAIHVGLGLWALYQRRQFHRTTIEPLQLLLGLSIPVLVMSHIVGVRLGETLFAHEKLYPQVLYGFWVSSPNRLWLVTTALIVAWLHGCIGLYFWLRMKRVLQTRGAVSARSRRAGADAGAARNLPGRPRHRSRQRQPAMGGGQSLAAATRHAGATEDPRRHHRGFACRLSRPDRRRARRARRARPCRAARRHDRPLLWQWQDGARGEGTVRARGQPAPQRAACQRLRRPRPLLDLPHPRDRRLQRPAGAVGARGLRAGTGRRDRSVDPSGLPVAADLGSRVLPAVYSAHRVGQCPCVEPHADRPGALSRQPVRGHARLDPARGEAPAVRHRLHRQSLSRGRLAGRDRPWRPAQPVRRRRYAGAVRACRQSGNRLPAGAQGGSRDRGQCRRVEPVSRARFARADPLRHRRSRAAR